MFLVYRVGIPNIRPLTFDPEGRLSTCKPLEEDDCEQVFQFVGTMALLKATVNKMKLFSYIN